MRAAGQFAQPGDDADGPVIDTAPGCVSPRRGARTEYARTMIYRWLVRKQAAAVWRRWSKQRFDETRLSRA
jgi:hypothetical protein